MMRDDGQMLSVWFFIGVLLLAYGIIILITAIVEFSHTPAIVLAQYRPGLWGGIVLVLVGGFYAHTFRPGKK